MTALVVLLLICSTPGLVLVLVVIAGIDRVGLAANRLLRLPWRQAEYGRPIAAAGVAELGSMVQPTKRYELDERKSSLLLRDETGDGAPPQTEVSLDKGFAIIRPPRSGSDE